MNLEPDFVRLFEASLQLWDGSQDTPFMRSQVERVLGATRTLKYTETILVGTALVNPSDPVVTSVLWEISPTDLIYDRHKELWIACRDVSALPQEPDREQCLRQVCYQIWLNSKRPTSDFPEAATHAILLSAQFVSCAEIRSVSRSFREAAAEARLRRRILEIAANFREDHSSAHACLDRLCALRDEVAVYGA